jgi:hypothetical protein
MGRPLPACRHVPISPEYWINPIRTSRIVVAQVCVPRFALCVFCGEAVDAVPAVLRTAPRISGDFSALSRSEGTIAASVHLSSRSIDALLEALLNRVLPFALQRFDTAALPAWSSWPCDVSLVHNSVDRLIGNASPAEPVPPPILFETVRHQLEHLRSSKAAHLRFSYASV